jgi:DNA-directed RNA polymerase
MTVGYGVTRYGAGQQIVEDTIDLSEDLRNQERLWAVMMGSLIYDTCREELGGPARLLQLFETLAARANERGEYLSWTVPATNFPVVQSYRQPVTQRTKLKIGRHELKIRFENWAEATLKESSQISGASPNMVHSLDAAHMTMVVASVDYDIAVIHDSFGCLPGRMDHLFSLVREKFTELYEQNPLQQILEQLNATDLMPDLGSLDLSEVTKSDFAFS